MSRSSSEAVTVSWSSGPSICSASISPPTGDAGPPGGYLEDQTGAQLLSLAWNGTLLLFDAEGRLVGDTPVKEDVAAVAPNGDSFFLRGAEPRVIAGDRGRYAVAGPSSISIVDAGVEVLRPRQCRVPARPAAALARRAALS